MMRVEAENTTPILFVDDDPEARRAFARAMHARGFEVDLAAGAHDAVLQASRREYALIATDLDMPEVNGLHLVEQLTQTQPNATYILVTGVQNLQLPRSLAADHISSVVAKPWDADELAQCIWQGLRRRRDRETGWYEPATNPGVADALGSVLILESDPLDPDFMLRSLVLGGLPDYQVIQSSRLSHAVSIAQQRHFQIIVTELSLPDARGLDAVRALREAAPTTPLVAIGGVRDEALALEALRAGAQDYLVREQLTPDNMRRCLRFAIERQRAEDSLPRRRSIAPADDNLFPDAVTAALARARRDKNRVAVMYLSLTRNCAEPDSATQPLSGAVVKRVMHRVRTTLREYDTLAYLGSNRLGIILPDIQSGDRAGVPAERMLQELARPFLMGDTSISLNVTLGIGVYPDDADTAEELCRCADMAGYRAQALGSGVYEFFDEECQASSRANFQLNLELERALEQQEFVLHYRLQHALITGQVVAAEGVLLWQRPDGQVWHTDQFMHLLEERGLTSRLTAWMLNEGCRQGKAWQDLHPGLGVALDLSAVQLQDPELLQKVAAALSRGELAPQLLELEIEEHAILVPGVSDVLDNLSALGVRLTIDDFGQQLPLARLSQLPISAIKIGPNLADLAGNDARGAALIRAAVTLSRDLDIDLSAMGVDDPAQLDFLLNVGVQRAQGDLYGPACTADTTWLSVN
jgi:EAL domain-containing protein (putative c-di-GMP-specific phosphodiesterase class I)/PleD family two-component response regulator